MTKPKRKKYAIIMNLGGLHERVYTVYEQRSDSSNEWWHPGGNISVNVKKPSRCRDYKEIVFDDEETAKAVLEALKLYKKHIEGLL